MALFNLPPLTLPTDVIAKQAGIQLGAGYDAPFLNSILGVSNGGGLFTNPFSSAISSITDLTSQVQSLTGIASSVGALTPLTGIVTNLTSMTTIFNNIATNIVPTQLPMPSALAAGVTSAVGSLPNINPNDAPCLGPFITSLGVPQLGQILTLSHSQYVLSQMCGTVNAANPLPLLNQFSSMLTDMTAGAESFVSSVTSTVTNLLSTAASSLSGALSGGLSSVEGVMGSAFGGPIANFGSGIFSTIKDQMATGLGVSMRQMVETNYALKFMITGTDSTLGGAFGGILNGGVASAIKNFPSAVNLGNIIP